MPDDDAAELLGCATSTVRAARRFLVDAGVLAPQERVGLRWHKPIVYWPRRPNGPSGRTVRVPGQLLLDVLDGNLDLTALRVLCLIVMGMDGASASCAYTVPEICARLTKGPAAVRSALDQLQAHGWLLALPGYRNAATWVPLRWRGRPDTRESAG